jgi:hypothetical protein
MILDSQNQYSAGQVLSATGPSANIIDHGANRNLGVGEDICVVVTVVVAPVSTGTYSAQLQTNATDPTFGTPVNLASVTISPTAAAGTKYIIPIGEDASVLRYTRVNYTLGGTNPAITVTAEMQPTNMLQNDYYFPRGYYIQ